ncbi:MAG: phosphorothioated DNA-binding restriction endonuclease [Salinivenus sp.]
MEASSSFDQIRSRFDDLTVWKRGDQRAPHKPLLALYAMGQLVKGNRWLLFSDIEEDMEALLIEFGPPRKSHHPEYPFWHLQSDGVWVVPKADTLEMRKSASNPPKAELREKNAHGGFTDAVYRAFQHTPSFRREVARMLLSAHFPSSLHSDIADAVGLTLGPTDADDRDPKFRDRVLRAYQYQCAVCGFDLRIGNQGTPIGLEAAHIKWKQARGPDEISNGIALCALHHKMLDKGALHVTQELRLIVSEAVHGSDPHLSRLKGRHGEQIHTPQRTTYYPDNRVVTWHVNEVFRGPARA